MVRDVDVDNEAEDNDDLFMGLTYEEITYRFEQAVLLANKRQQVMGCPVQKLDEESGIPYLLYANGDKKYANPNP